MNKQTALKITKDAADYKDASNMNGFSFVSMLFSVTAFAYLYFQLRNIIDLEVVFTAQLVNWTIVPLVVAGSLFSVLSFIICASALGKSRRGTFIASFTVTLLGLFLALTGSALIYYFSFNSIP